MYTVYVMDKELEEYKKSVGKDNYQREYNRLYLFAKQSKARFSKKEYENDKDKLNDIKEKYKNGVNMNHINEMLGIKTIKG